MTLPSASRKFAVLFLLTLALTIVACKRASTPSTDKKDYVYLFEGKNGTTINGVPVSNFGEFLEGFYEGKISLLTAQKYLFTPMTMDHVVLSRVMKDWLIYSVHQNHLHEVIDYEFAMRRDFREETETIKRRGFDTIQENYQTARSKKLNNAYNPIEEGMVAVTGVETFTTQAGLVKQLPVVSRIRIK